MRSVFVSQLSARVTDRELGQFFEMQAGKVREAKVITDRISRRSKGLVHLASLAEMSTDFHDRRTESVTSNSSTWTPFRKHSRCRILSY